VPSDQDQDDEDALPLLEDDDRPGTEDVISQGPEFVPRDQDQDDGNAPPLPPVPPPGGNPGYDDEIPDGGAVIVLRDNDSPGTEDVISQGPELTPHEKVRKHLALAIMWSLLAIYGATVGVFLVDKLTGNRLSESALTTTIAAISGLQGLGAAIVGFYFGVQEKSQK
jgi:hypothetical protein